MDKPIFTLIHIHHMQLVRQTRILVHGTGTNQMVIALGCWSIVDNQALEVLAGV